MNAITATYDQLAVALTADPLLLLASTAAIFDPFWAAFEEEEIDYETDPLTIALQVTRGAFPDIYAEAVERLRLGAPYADLDRLVCQAITAKGIPLNDLETIGWGIPLEAVGVDLEDPEFYAVHPELLSVLRLFGTVRPEDEMYRVELPNGIFDIGYVLASSLHEQTDPVLRQIGWALGWLFGCTGNSLVDYTDETLSEFQPLAWLPDDIAFAIEMIEEADGIMQDAVAGLEALKTMPELRQGISDNAKRVSEEINQKGKSQTPPLHWRID